MTLLELNQHYELVEKLTKAREMLQSLRDAACPGAADPLQYEQPLNVIPVATERNNLSVAAEKVPCPPLRAGL